MENLNTDQGQVQPVRRKFVRSQVIELKEENKSMKIYTIEILKELRSQQPRIPLLRTSIAVAST